MIDKETIIHIKHYPLQYLQSQIKLQKYHHFRCMGFLQQFHFVIKYKKGTNNKVVDMISTPLVFASIVLNNSSLSHDSYAEQYAIDEDIIYVYERLTHGSQVENYYLHGNLLYHLGKLCIPKSEIVHNLRSSHFSCVWELWGRKNFGSFV